MLLPLVVVVLVLLLWVWVLLVVLLSVVVVVVLVLLQVLLLRVVVVVVLLLLFVLLLVLGFCPPPRPEGLRWKPLGLAPLARVFEEGFRGTKTAVAKWTMVGMMMMMMPTIAALA